MEVLNKFTGSAFSMECDI